MSYIARLGLFARNVRNLVNTNPVLGKELVKLATPGFLLRIDGRPIKEICDTDGMPARLSIEALEGVTRNQIVEYQEHSVNPFGIGACQTLKDLENGYASDNKALSRSRNLYGFIANGAPMVMIRAVLLHEPGNRDYEIESIVMDHVPLNAILFATSPKFRPVFEEGGRVANEMVEVSSVELPRILTREDVKDEASVFDWLLKHNCEEAAANMCSIVFAPLNPVAISRRLGDDKRLVSAVQSILQDLPTSLVTRSGMSLS